MSPREVIYGDTGETVGWACSKCGVMYSDRMFGGRRDASKKAAAGCCDRRCEHCGEPAQLGSTVCKPCRVVREKKREAERFAKATKVALSDYGLSVVYMDGFGSDGYVDIDCLRDELEERFDQGLAIPEYAWACSERDFHVDLVEVIENDLVDEAYEGAWDDVDKAKVAEAQKIVDEALAGIAIYEADHRRAVLLPLPRPKEDRTPPQHPPHLQ